MNTPRKILIIDDENDHIDLIRRELKKNQSYIVETASTVNQAINLLKTSPTRYRLEIESDEPAFIYLGDTYHSAWNAYCNGKKLEHFQANWWANGFYLEGTGKNTVDIVFERQTTRYIMCGMWALGWLIILVGICHFSRRKIEEKLKDKDDV